MKSSTRLDSAIFQLTPTRTRCDLIIVANERKEKTASGLMNPFLSHLKTAQDQIAKGGYSILLQPEQGSDSTWFTKGTVERFIRFVSTPEILERVQTIESEILQIEEVIVIQGSIDNRLSWGENRREKPVDGSRGNKGMLDDNREKAIALCKPDEHPSDINGAIIHEGNPKVHLLKVLQTRKTMLQKEQGMAFARAVAAGFDIDQMKALVSFAECFGSSRLMRACLNFMDMWKRKHETGQWLEIEVVEAMSNQTDFLRMNASEIMLSAMANKQNESSCDIASKINLKVAIQANSDDRPLMDLQVPGGQQEFFRGQFPHHMFPCWPLQSSPGTSPVFQAYPVEGIPCLQSHLGNGAFYQAPCLQTYDYQFSVGHGTRQGRQSLCDNTGSAMCEMEATSTSLDNLNLEKKSSPSHKPRKKAEGLGEKHAGMVIQNINYITSKAKYSAGNDSESSFDSGGDSDKLEASDAGIMHKSTLKSSKRKGSLVKSMDESSSYAKEERDCVKETDAGQWQAFQNLLLRGTDEDNPTTSSGIFSREKDIQMKRRQNAARDDPLALGKQEVVESQDRKINQQNIVTRKVPSMLRASNDEFIINGNGHKSVFRDSSHGQNLNGVEHFNSDLNRNLLHNISDESFMIPFRSMSINQAGADERTMTNTDSELSLTQGKSESISTRIISQVNNMPHDLTLMPERGTEKSTIGCDMDYKVQFFVKDAASLNKRSRKVVTDMKQRSAKLDKDSKPILTQGTSHKKTGRALGKGKPSKLIPIDDARARAERIRAFKDDLKKIKKEKVEAELKRLEALKKERQNRIASRGSSTSAQSSLSSLQKRKQLATKLSPLSHKGSKFSDSEPGLSSPLQRSKIRSSSLGSFETKKVSKTLRSSDGGHSAGNRSSRSLLPLSELKKGSSGDTPDSKISMARIRRLSEPRNKTHPTSSIKTLNGGPISRTKTSSALKPKASDTRPESKKIPASVNLDERKATTLLDQARISKSKGPSHGGPNILARSSVTSQYSTTKMNNGKMSHQSDVHDEPVIEKTLVILEREKPIPAVVSTVERMEEGNIHEMGNKIEQETDYTALRAMSSPPYGVDSDLRRLRGEHISNQVATNYEENNLPKSSSINTTKKPYQAPSLWASSSEDASVVSSEYDRVPSTLASVEIAKARRSNSQNLKLEKIPENVEKPQMKESLNVFKRFLKFGRKNNSPAADHTINHTACREDTLRSLISQTETFTGDSYSQKSSRHFSLSSPFRSKR